MHKIADERVIRMTENCNPSDHIGLGMAHVLGVFEFAYANDYTLDERAEYLYSVGEIENFSGYLYEYKELVKMICKENMLK